MVKYATETKSCHSFAQYKLHHCMYLNIELLKIPGIRQQNYSETFGIN